MSTTTTYTGIRIVDMPDLGAVTDDSSVVGEHLGSGRFSAKSLRNYLSPDIKSFGAKGDGVADDSFAIQAAIDALSATGGVVTCPPGTYRITVALRMRPNVTLHGSAGSIIKQGNGAALASLIDFNAYAAANATIDGLTLNGNGTNNTANLANALDVSAQSGSEMANCTFTDASGNALVLSGQYPVVRCCVFSMIRGVACQLSGPTPNFAMRGVVRDNLFSNIGMYVIPLKWADSNIISGNQLIGMAFVHNVSTSGTAVTWVSGATFTGMIPGNYMRIAGAEYLVASVNSSTSITLTASAGTLTNQPAISGTGDQIGMNASSFNVVTGNRVHGGMSISIGVSTNAGTESSFCNIISGNEITNGGNCGIALFSDDPTSFTDSTIISGNNVTSCGVGRSANLANSNNGIWITGARTSNTLISGNACRDLANAQDWGVYISPEVPAGATRVSGNLLANNLVGEISGGGWRQYAPSVSVTGGGLGGTTVSGRYRLADKTVSVQIYLTITANGTGSGGIILGLPVAAAATLFVLTGRAVNSTKAVTGMTPNGGSTVGVLNFDGSYPGATGETIVLTGVYEAV
jgi:hypothetical protein